MIQYHMNAIIASEAYLLNFFGSFVPCRYNHLQHIIVKKF